MSKSSSVSEVQAYLDKHSACCEGAKFALQYTTMADVWDNCTNMDWLLWICAREDIQLDDKAARLFACWCVRNTPLAGGRVVWDLLTDERSKNAVIVSERFANGEASQEDLDAAWAAARAAARAAAWNAAWAAARAAARAAAWDAARAAARDAAWDAAWDAARDAAWGAARDAAWGAARDAAWGAAWDAARDAAWGAARAAARAAQCNQLRTLIPNPFRKVVAV